MNPKAIGERSEGMILAALLRKGKVVLIPFGDNQRYDLVIDEGNTFLRVQCKTGRIRNGAVYFSTCSQHCLTHERKDYIGQIDLFGVYCPELDKVYLVPLEGLPMREASLRLVPARNNQRSRVRLAESFELR